jgi:hypothetical protein
MKNTDDACQTWHATYTGDPSIGCRRLTKSKMTQEAARGRHAPLPLDCGAFARKEDFSGRRNIEFLGVVALIHRHAQAAP